MPFYGESMPRRAVPRVFDRLSSCPGTINSPSNGMLPFVDAMVEEITTHAKQIDGAVTRLTEIDRQLSDRQIREIGKVLSEVIIKAGYCRTDDAGT